MPTITIDLSWFNQLGQLPPLTLVWTIFVYGGFVPFVWLVWTIFKELWLQSRQEKYAATITYSVLNIDVPRLNEQSPKAVEHIFSHLAGTHQRFTLKDKWITGKFHAPFSFELVSVNGYTRFIVRTPTVFRDLIEAGVFSQYPEAEITELADYTNDVPDKYPDPEWDCWGTEFGLAKPSAYPIRTWVEFEHVLSGEFKDPLGTMLESMARLKQNEQVWLQILVWTTDQGWAKESGDLVKKIMGKEAKHKPGIMGEIAQHGTDIAVGVLKQAFGPAETGKPEIKKDEKPPSLSSGEKKVLEGIENKMTKTGFECKLRLIYVGKRGSFRKGPVLSMMRGALGLFGSLDSNSFRANAKVIPKTDYFWQAWSAEKKKTNVMAAYKQRSGEGGPTCILNIEELASIWHFPQVFVKAPLIKKVDSKKVEPPFQLPLA